MMILPEFIGAFLPFYRTFRKYRILNIQGVVGGHKTAMAFRLAYKLWQDGYVDFVLSNVASVWNDDFARLAAGIQDVRHCRIAIILDEAGQYMKDRHDVSVLFAAPRKLDLYFLMASVHPVTLKARVLTLVPTVDAQSFGVPVQRFEMILDDNLANKSRYGFYWTRLKSIYGVYDTSAMPLEASQIVDFMLEMLDRLNRLSGGSGVADSRLARASHGLASPGLLSLSDDGGVDAIEDAVGELQAVSRRVGDQITKLGSIRK